MGQFKHYYDYVELEAGNLFSDFRDEMIEEVEQGNTELYNFFDDHVHYWVDSDMCGCDLLDHAEVLEQSEDVESDWGLWEGMKDPRKAIESQAFFTYRGDLMRAVIGVAKLFLDDLRFDSDRRIADLEERLDNLRDRLHDLQEEHETSEGAELVEAIQEVESDIMLTEELIDEEQDKLNNFLEAIQS